ncbi:unnamed protein product [Amoebophrya sp. A25]|nr:unnamed protein product [Amoebophrya sp. A25]|eukprot:GSA25T00020030001.1
MSRVGAVLWVDDSIKPRREDIPRRARALPLSRPGTGPRHLQLGTAKIRPPRTRWFVEDDPYRGARFPLSGFAAKLVRHGSAKATGLKTGELAATQHKIATRTADHLLTLSNPVSESDEEVAHHQRTRKPRSAAQQIVRPAESVVAGQVATFRRDEFGNVIFDFEEKQAGEVGENRCPLDEKNTHSRTIVAGNVVLNFEQKEAGDKDIKTSPNTSTFQTRSTRVACSPRREIRPALEAVVVDERASPKKFSSSGEDGPFTKSALASLHFPQDEEERNTSSLLAPSPPAPRKSLPNTQLAQLYDRRRVVAAAARERSTTTSPITSSHTATTIHDTGFVNPSPASHHMPPTLLTAPFSSFTTGAPPGDLFRGHAADCNFSSSATSKRKNDNANDNKNLVAANSGARTAGTGGLLTTTSCYSSRVNIGGEFCEDFAVNTEGSSSWTTRGSVPPSMSVSSSGATLLSAPENASMNHGVEHDQLHHSAFASKNVLDHPGALSGTNFQGQYGTVRTMSQVKSTDGPFAKTASLPADKFLHRDLSKEIVKRVGLSSAAGSRLFGSHGRIKPTWREEQAGGGYARASTVKKIGGTATSSSSRLSNKKSSACSPRSHNAAGAAGASSSTLSRTENNKQEQHDENCPRPSTSYYERENAKPAFHYWTPLVEPSAELRWKLELDECLKILREKT